MDGDNIMAIVCHKVVPLEMASKFATKTLWLFVKRGWMNKHLG
jgi:hypothetical protein